MSPLILGLTLKYGVPLAIRLIDEGKAKDEQEAIETAQGIIADLAFSDSITEQLVSADKEQTEFIVACLYGALTEAIGAIQELITNLRKIGQPTEVKK